MKYITPANFEGEVINSSVPVLVQFYSETCNLSRLMASSLADIASHTRGTLKLVRIEAEPATHLIELFNVTAIPSCLLFRSGQCLARLKGVRTRQEVLTWLADALPSA